MEIFFNELSHIPLADTPDGAKSLIYRLLETLKSLRPSGFNVMRVSSQIFELQLANEYTLTNFFSDTSISRDLKILLKGVMKRPYIDNDDSYEAEIFVLSTFTTTDPNGDELSPEGLAIAHLYNSPTVSLSSIPYWQREWIPLTVITEGNTTNENVINIYTPENIEQTYFKNWLKRLIDETELNDEISIAKVFSPDKFAFDRQAIDDIYSWYYNDKRFLIRIRELIYDISENPFTGGKGHTETLAGSSGRASKRIVKKDRLVYTFTEQKITIHQCRGHYTDK